MSNLIEFKNFGRKKNVKELKFNNVGYNQFDFEYSNSNLVTISTAHLNSESAVMSVEIVNDNDQFEYDFELDLSSFNTLSLNTRNKKSLKTNNNDEYAYEIKNLTLNNNNFGDISADETFSFSADAPFEVEFNLCINPDQPIQNSFLKLETSQVVVPEPANYSILFAGLLVGLLFCKKILTNLRCDVS